MKLFKKWFYPAVFVSSVILIAWFFYTYASYTSVLRSMQLTTCTNDVLKFHLQVPKGRNFALVLGTPEVQKLGAASSNAFSGHVQILNGSSPIASFLIDSKLAQACNWLQGGETPYGLVLTGSSNTNCPNLSALIQPQKDYDIEIVFDHAPAVTASLWLCWVQAYKDREKNK